MLTGNAAAAWGARLAGVDYIPAFPITPQTEIIETLARWCQNGEMPARLVMMDSEHSMLAAAAGAAATGVRVFTATSSQGLLYGFEMLYAIAGLALAAGFGQRFARACASDHFRTRSQRRALRRAIPVFSSFIVRPARKCSTRS